MKSEIANLKSGYVTLVSVLVAAAVGITVASSLLLLGLGATRTSYTFGLSNQSKSIANACAEEALQKIRDSAGFSGTGSLNFGSGKSCTYTVAALSGENRTVTTSANVGGVIRKIKIDINKIIPNITFSSWQEVAD